MGGVKDQRKEILEKKWFLGSRESKADAEDEQQETRRRRSLTLELLG